MNFNKKEDQEYVDVADRIQEFKLKHPNYMIDTDIVFNEGSNVFAIKCVIKSEIGQVLASGHSMGRYDKDSDFFGGKLIETVETTAVGRALAFLGIKSTKAIASKDEIDQAKDMKSSSEKKKAVSNGKKLAEKAASKAKEVDYSFVTDDKTKKGLKVLGDGLMSLGLTKPILVLKFKNFDPEGKYANHTVFFQTAPKEEIISFLKSIG